MFHEYSCDLTIVAEIVCHPLLINYIDIFPILTYGCDASVWHACKNEGRDKARKSLDVAIWITRCSARDVDGMMDCC